MAPANSQTEIKVPYKGFHLNGTLAVPPDANGIVIFAHGSGSSRFSPRNTLVAEYLNGDGLITFLFDLLTPREEILDNYTLQLRFDTALLGNRLVHVTEWLMGQSFAQGQSIGYFGASTGAAAALMAAAILKDQVEAVVSRGGRPDLAGPYLPQVKAPTLLLVGSRDEQVLRLNEDAAQRMEAPVTIAVIPGASHLFEEPGKLEEVARSSSAWFSHYLAGRPLATTSA